MVGAAIDLGSNSFICFIFKMGSDGKVVTLSDQIILTRLSEGIDKDKTLSKAALMRAEEAFAKFSADFKKYGVQKILGVATSAVRDAKNQKEFLDIANQYGIPVQILSGLEEAQMTFEGVKDQLQGSAGVIIDIGGGSTEYIYVEDDKIQDRISLDMGVVRFAERYKTFGEYQNAEAELTQAIRVQLESSDALKRFKSLEINMLLAVSGTPTNAASILIGEFDPSRIEGFVLTDAALQFLTLSYSYLTLEERLKAYPFVEEKRADVLPVGIAILYESLRFFGINSYKVSTQGIRHGAAKIIFST